MNKPNRNRKWIATFFLTIFLPTLLPVNALYASNNGPNAPEAASFEPVDASDMVSLATGDMAYVLPLLNVPSPEGGYPISLAYHGGIGFDQESSMVGMGWNLNPGAINRNVNGVPDDWKGALVRDKEHFEAWGKSVDLSAGYANINASLGYSWDSNGTKRGSVAVGVGSDLGGGLKLNVGVGAALSNKTGLSANVTAGVGMKNGFGVGVYADTDGLMAIGVGHTASFGSTYANGSTRNGGSMSTVGISLSSNKGKVGVGLSAGGASVMSSNSGSSSSSSMGISAGIYLYGFFVKLGYQQSTFERNKLDGNYVYGPLYYSALSNDPKNSSGLGVSYPGSLANEHNRDFYMDAYNQPIPEYAGNAVAYNTVFDSQKAAYNAPSYDTYEVNAQGLSGRMSPRLLENGLIINAGTDVQYEEEDHGIQCDGNKCLPLWQYPITNCTIPNHWGNRITDKRIYVNSHYSTDQYQKFKNTFGQNNSIINFYFDYQFPSDLRVNPIPLSAANNAAYLENYFVASNTTITARKENSDFIETFTNKQIVNGNTNGQFLEAKGYDRSLDGGYRPDGIGGYKITTVDGKTYHYSRPVYQFEQIYRQLQAKKENGMYLTSYAESDGTYREVRKTEPYATHWLLTAITGPDYVKMSNNTYPDEGDYGYWVRFDYGKWTDGYAWRTPYNGYENRSDNTTEVAEEYSWGRKQLVYLDKVVTRTHTALFVKSLRNDDIGKAIGAGGYPTSDGDTEVTYLGQRSLKLDEIILLKNSDYSNSVEASTQVTNLTNEPNSHTAHWNSIGSTPSSPENYITYSLNQQFQVIDKGDFSVNTTTGKLDIYSKALKVIKLNQSYDLAKGSPNSDAPITKGRLTLESVEALGKEGESFIPPYTFEYIGKDTNYDESSSKKDAWGYNVNDPSLWTLNKIHTPTGASIEFDYEKDQYYTEAFSRRMFDEDNLMFRLYFQGSQAVIEFQKHAYWNDPIDFTQYFDASDPTWGSLFCCHDNPAGFFSGGDKDWISISGKPFTIKSVTPTSVIFYLPPYEVLEPNYQDITDTEFRGKNLGFCFVGNQCLESSNTSYTFNFKLMANKTPGTGYGGGIRVAKISSVNEIGEKTATEYNYNDPIKNRTSGITSYAPAKGRKYVAYQSEIPGPRVMYEYVTLTEKGINNESLGSTQYQFNVLKPVLNVFDPNLQEGDHFKATASVNQLDASKKTIGVDVKLEDNFATIGSLVKVSQINKAGQIMSQQKNNYLTLNELRDNSIEKPGALQESFHSMKSIYDWQKDYISGTAGAGITWSARCEISEDIVANKRIANSSSKITYPMVLKSKEEIVGNQRQLTEFKKIDPKTGMFLESHTTMANGTMIKTEQVPAYTKYPAMGSKVDNINNKHMLTQEAMNITSVKVDNVWRTANANITTWNNTWAYRNEALGTDEVDNINKVWRKHKSFAWKEGVNTKGVYNTTIDNTNPQFNWGLGTPLSNNWQKLSEITKYNHFSSTMETKDINGNFASSKMADNNTKVIVSGNARYTEMYYSGAEYVKSGNYFEGEVQGANYRSDNVAHTGKYSVKPNAIGDKVFEVKGSSGSANYYANPNIPYAETFRPGKYKVSFWALKEGDATCKSSTPNQYGVNLLVNNVVIAPTEVVGAGCWQQLNYIIDIPENNTQNTISTEFTGTYCGGSVYFDDFRMHPIASSINSYVYDDKTDELSYTLDANNMGSAYKYDNAGRLIGNYIEDVDNGANLGGFKLIGQSKQNYINKNTTTINLPSTIDNCLHINNNLSVNISNQCVGTFGNKFNVAVSGGSGNYSYQYKWLTNVANNIYTNYINGGSQYIIPYAPRFCLVGTADGAYAKRWDFVVKVKDLATNFEIEKAYNYEGNCDFKKAYYLDSGLEISKCYPLCPGEENAFRIHLKDIGDATNVKYEYAYYNPSMAIQNQTLNWIDATSTNGMFCPIYSGYPDASCSSGIRKILYITFRVTNLATGQLVNSYPIVYFGSCNPIGNNLPIIENSNPLDAKYQNDGILLIKDAKGYEIIDFYNVNK